MTRRFERAALYEEVWTTSLRQLSKKYEMSDNGLRKICRAMNIPLPTAGHWAKVAAGHSIPRTPLPAEAERETFVSHAPPREPNFRLPEDDTWLAAMTAQEIDPQWAIAYDIAPRHWHPVIKEHRRKLTEKARTVVASRRAAERFDKLPDSAKSRQIDHDGITWRFILNSGQIFSAGHKAAVLRVSLETYERALAILNAVALAAVQRGFEVEDAESDGRIIIDGHGGAATLRITERLEDRTRKVRSYDDKWLPESYKVPTGALRLFLETRRSTGVSLEDKPGQPLENQLHAMFTGLYRMVVRSRIAQRAGEERSRKWAESERLREAAAQLRREEERRIEDARRQRQALLADAESWSQAQRLREYIAHISKAATKDSTSPSHQGPIETWMEWANGVANELDPSTRYWSRQQA